RREGAERRDRVLQAQIAKEAEMQQDLKQERDKALDEVAALKATVEKFTRAGAEATAREVEAGGRDRALQAQIAKAAAAYQDLKRERDKVLDDVTALKTTVEELTQARADAKAKQADAQQALTRDRNKALDEVVALKATVEELTQAREHAEARAVELSQHLRKVRHSKAQETARSIGAALSPLVIAAAVATLGFWTYQLIWSAPQPSPAVMSDSTADAETKLKAAEIEQQRLQEEVQGQAKAATELQTKLQAAQAEQQQQARAIADADSKRKAAEAEQQRQAKLATDADAKRRGAEAEQQRLAEELRKVRAEAATKQVALPQATSTVMVPAFESRPDMEGTGRMPSGSDRTITVQACQERCTQSGTCRAFTFSKTSNFCFLYDLLPTFRGNSAFDSGVRQSAPR